VTWARYLTDPSMQIRPENRLLGSLSSILTGSTAPTNHTLHPSQVSKPTVCDRAGVLVSLKTDEGPTRFAIAFGGGGGCLWSPMGQSSIVAQARPLQRQMSLFNTWKKPSLPNRWTAVHVSPGAGAPATTVQTSPTAATGGHLFTTAGLFAYPSLSAICTPNHPLGVGTPFPP
jgi:hypothetical protein